MLLKHYLFKAFPMYSIKIPFQALPLPCRGGAGISKGVRPLQINDRCCMWRGGDLQQAAVRTTCRIEIRGCRCSPVVPRRALPDSPGKKRERSVHKGQRRACVGHLAQLSECLCSLRTGPTTRWKVVRPRLDQPDRRRRHCHVFPSSHSWHSLYRNCTILV